MASAAQKASQARFKAAAKRCKGQRARAYRACIARELSGAGEGLGKRPRGRR